MSVENDLKSILVGRKIVETHEDSKMTLDNGVVLDFEGYGDCCAWANVEKLAKYDHVITDVKFTCTDNEVSNHAFIYALSETSVETEIAHIVGDPGPGCYLFGVTIGVNGKTMCDIEL